jgi:hypothetical protein
MFMTSHVVDVQWIGPSSRQLVILARGFIERFRTVRLNTNMVLSLLPRGWVLDGRGKML